jgi:hypothetical protein
VYVRRAADMAVNLFKREVSEFMRGMAISLVTIRHSHFLTTP